MYIIKKGNFNKEGSVFFTKLSKFYEMNFFYLEVFKISVYSFYKLKIFKVHIIKNLYLFILFKLYNLANIA